MAPRRLDSIRDALVWLAERGAVALTTDSRRVAPGAAFIAWPGHAQDGRQYVTAALDAGAAACLVEAEGVEAFGFDDGRIAALPRLKAATGPLAAAFAGAPSRALRVIASTGTNGKTSTAWWVAQALTALGARCGVIGTLGVGEPPLGDAPGRIESTGLTTPDPVTLQDAFRRFADAGFAACAIEASSIGLAEHRLDGTAIDTALYTNFTRDHVDYHGSMTAYWFAKSRLFEWPGLRAAVINVDDEQGAAVARQFRDGPMALWTYAVHRPARLRALDVGYADGGLGFELHEGGQRAAVRTSLIGDYNVSNLLAVVGALRAAGVPLADAAAACSRLGPVPGRMQRVPGAAGEPEAVVDYAHTPDALEKALQALRPLTQARSGALWCVFGCGGNRDATKRPLMGALAVQLADHAVVTSDNPRGEAPAAILSQIVAGMAQPAQAIVIEDRREAIRHAVRTAAANDVILIAGKGHEDYQEIAGARLPFSDAAEARAALDARRAAA